MERQETLKNESQLTMISDVATPGPAWAIEFSVLGTRVQSCIITFFGVIITNLVISLDPPGVLCDRLNNDATNLYFAIIIYAVGTLAVLCLTQRRARLFRGCLWGIPGIVVPVNLLSISRFRLVYAVIFGAMSSAFLTLTQGGVFSFTAENIPLRLFYRFVLQPLLSTLVVSLTFFPYFACVNAPIVLIGHILGFIYSILFFVTVLITDSTLYIGCSDKKDYEVVLSGVGAIPVYCCHTCILVWYAYSILKDIWNLCGVRGSNTNGGCSQQLLRHEDAHYPFHYVKHLLQRHDGRQCCGGKVGQLMTPVFQCLCPYNRGFRFPLKFLGALFVMFIILYELSFVVFSGNLIVGTSAVDSWKENGRSFTARLLDKNESSTDVSDIYNNVLLVLRGIAAVIALAPFIAFTLSFILLIHLAITVHKDLLKVTQCGLADIFPGKPPTQATALAASLRYAGQQIGYFIWAWFIYWVLSIGLGIAVLFLIFGLKFPFIRTSVAYVMGLILVSIGWATIVSIVQLVLCKFVFLEKSSGKFLIITNRRLFNWFAYVLLFYNALVGIVGAFLRILFSAVFGILLIFRVDRLVLMKGFEFFDFGHTTYLGFIYVEHTYNNPIVNAFVQLLKNATDSSGRNNLLLHHRDYVEADEFLTGASSRKQARNRWLVAYTLLKNPSLTANRVQAEDGTHVASGYDDMYTINRKSTSGKRKNKRLDSQALLLDEDDAERPS